MRYLFIVLEVVDGVRTHVHKVLHTTNAENIEFAAELYAAKYWGYSYRNSRDDDFWFAHGGEIAIKLEKVVELTEEKYKELYNLLYY